MQYRFIRFPDKFSSGAIFVEELAALQGVPQGSMKKRARARVPHTAAAGYCWHREDRIGSFLQRTVIAEISKT